MDSIEEEKRDALTIKSKLGIANDITKIEMNAKLNLFLVLQELGALNPDFKLPQCQSSTAAASTTSSA